MIRGIVVSSDLMASAVRLGGFLAAYGSEGRRYKSLDQMTLRLFSDAGIEIVPRALDLFEGAPPHPRRKPSSRTPERDGRRGLRI